MSTITWLHLSDWHEGGTDFDRTVVRRALLADVEARTHIAPELGQVDFIVFTGDIAWSGDDAQYRSIDQTLLRPLFASTGIPGYSRLFTVPGNHDLNRATIGELQKQLNLTFTDRQGLNEALSSWQLAALMSPFSAYAQFARQGRDAAEVASICPQAGYFSVHRIALENTRSIGILGLNSAWASARCVDSGGQVSDYGHLVVGERQVVDAFTALSSLGGADVVIAAMHHPFSWLIDFDRDLVEERLFRDCHFILHGHQHLPRVNIQQSTLGDVVVVPAGASWDGRYAINPRYTLSYNFVHIDLSRQQGTVFLRRWVDQEDRWRPAEEVGPEGRFVFSMPQRAGLTTPATLDARRRGIARVARRMKRRQCESMEVSILQKIESHDGLIFVRHESVHQLTFARGDSEELVQRFEADPSVIALAKDGRLNASPVEVEYFKVDDQVATPETNEAGLIRYRVRIPSSPATIRYKVRSLELIPGFVLLELGRITRRFNLQIQEAAGLKYHLIPLGGFPQTAPIPHELYTLQGLAVNDLCFPEQGLVCHWHLDAVPARDPMPADA